jgi:predicted RNA binding protein YcfA (HicA-like mRNA interferase family)
MKVRDVLRLLTRDGWVVVRTRGSHSQLRHPVKTGLVTIAGSGNDDIAPRTLKSILEPAGFDSRAKE